LNEQHEDSPTRPRLPAEPLDLISDAWALSSTPYNWSRRPEDAYGQGLIRGLEKACRDSLPRKLKKVSRIEAAAKRDLNESLDKY
jgi:hypothetical protein